TLRMKSLVARCQFLARPDFFMMNTGERTCRGTGALSAAISERRDQAEHDQPHGYGSGRMTARGGFHSARPLAKGRQAIAQPLGDVGIIIPRHVAAFLVIGAASPRHGLLKC